MKKGENILLRKRNWYLDFPSNFINKMEVRLYTETSKFICVTLLTWKDNKNFTLSYELTENENFNKFRNGYRKKLI